MSFVIWRQIETSGECEAAVAARMRIGRIEFRECSEFLLGKRFFVEIRQIEKLVENVRLRLRQE